MVDKGILSKLPSKLFSNNGEVNTSDVFKNHLIGLYFSADWCAPCREFTPLLSECYETWKNENKSIEIIYISSDKDDKEFNGYFNEMFWLAVPFKNQNVIKEFKTHFCLEYMPTFIVLDNKGNMIDSYAYKTVFDNDMSSYDEWMKKLKS